MFCQEIKQLSQGRAATSATADVERLTNPPSVLKCPLRGDFCLLTKQVNRVRKYISYPVLI